MVGDKGQVFNTSSANLSLAYCLFVKFSLVGVKVQIFTLLCGGQGGGVSHFIISNERLATGFLRYSVGAANAYFYHAYIIMTFLNLIFMQYFLKLISNILRDFIVEDSDIVSGNLL